jgi:predicted small lipoprotein YifL
MFRLVRFALLLALCAGLLVACGNKGPLVLPDQKPAQPASPTQDSGKQP